MRADRDLDSVPPAPADAEGERASWWARLSPRRRFRARLERDPRRWVLFIVALDGLVAPMLSFQEKKDSFFSWGVAAAVALVGMATLPTFAVLTMLFHGRLLHWTGRLLGGAAPPREIHAAFAWSQLPFVAVGWPLLLEIPLRAAAADLDPVPAWLSSAISFSETASEPVALVASVAAVIGVVLWVKYLAEAQRFSSWRAIVNQLLATACVVALLFGPVALFVGLALETRAAIHAAVAWAIVLAISGAVALVLRRRRRAPAVS